MLAQTDFAPANVGYVVAELATGKVLRSHQSDQTFIPASIIKLVTAYAALETMGADFQFETPVLAEQSSEGLRLHLSGGGDPVLVQEDLAQLARSLATRVGGQKVAQFTFDSGALPYIPAIDPGDDLANSYNPPVAALSVNFNRQWLKWGRDPDHRALLVQVSPNLGHATAGVAALRAPDGRPVQVLAGPTTRLLIEPRVPSQGSRRVAVRNPAYRTALMLQRFAENAGLSMPLPQQTPRPGNASIAATVKSRPMIGIAEALLEYSNNLSAELVGLASAQRLGHSPGTLRESAAAVQQWIGKPVPALAGEGIIWTNQSGLSGDARMSPNALLALLWRLRNTKYGETSFLDLLHEPRWSERDKDLLVRAKSGTMSYARGQAGVLETKDGRQFLFVLMITDFAARSAFEKNPLRFSNPVRRQAGRWLWRARTLERGLIRHWTETL